MSFLIFWYLKEWSSLFTSIFNGISHCHCQSLQLCVRLALLLVTSKPVYKQPFKTLKGIIVKDQVQGNGTEQLKVDLWLFQIINIVVCGESLCDSAPLPCKIQVQV